MKVLVTNCTRNTGLTMARAMARAGWETHGADDRHFPFGLKSRFVLAPYRRLPDEKDATFVPALLALLEQLRPDVLIPMRGVENICMQQHSVQRFTRTLLPKPGAFSVLNDKSALLALCADLGVAAPRVLSLEEAREQLRRCPGLPVVVKPCRDIGGGEGVHFIDDAEKLQGIHEQISNAYGPALTTEYIAGPTAALRAVHLLFDADSRLIANFVVQKLRIWPRSVGVSVAAVSVHDPELVRQIVPIFQALKWRGPADAELKIDPRDGKAKILEINPRFSGMSHFPIACGVNIPLRYCRAALGERLQEQWLPDYRAGVRFVSLARWLIALADQVRTRPGERLQVLRQAWQQEWHGPRVRSVHEAGDPAPILGRALLALRRPSERR
ncbi:MAG: ATP-grasp domain-containing protein [Pseudomonadota bacterium]|nr:ATP-grasp domain-containing protein [Pseudomonadota bacterium]